jgi:hypothetical protein
LKYYLNDRLVLYNWNIMALDTITLSLTLYLANDET